MESALFYAASRMQHSAGSIVMLYVIEPQEFQYWIGVRQVSSSRKRPTRPRRCSACMRRKLNNAGYENVACEEVIREGKKGEEIRQAHRRGRGYRRAGAGRLDGAAAPARWSPRWPPARTAGNFPIPITIVPGDLALEDIQALA